MSLTPYYERDGITIYCGDCLDIMPQLDVKFDAIIADLPYGKTEFSWDSQLPIDELWQNYKELRNDRCPVILTAKEPFASMLVMSRLDWYKHKWIWEKDKSVNFIYAACMPIASCEDILVFNSKGYAPNSKSKPVYNPQMEQGATFQGKTKSRRPILGSHSRERVKYNFTISSKDYDGWKRYPKMKLYFPVDWGKNRYHPTQKPIDLLAYLIRTYTNPQDIILDNTMGSGTTLVAAQQEGRQAVGIELSEEYCEIAVERLRQPSFFSIPPKSEKSNKRQLSLIKDTE